MIYKPKKKIKNIFKKKIKNFFLKIFFPFFFLFVFSIFIFNLKYLEVKNIEISGNKNVAEKEILEKINFSLEKKYLKIYKKKNFLFYPKKEIQKNILKNQKIKTAEISYKDFKGNLEVKISEKNPEFLYCILKDQCFFMEENGEIYTKFLKEESQKEKKDFFVFYEKTKIKNNFLFEKNFFSKIKKLISDLESFDLKVLSVEKNKDDFIFNLKSTKLIFSQNQNIEKIKETIEKISFQKNLKIDKIKKDFPKNILYINFSYGDNVFYCTSGAVCQNNF